MGFDNDGVVIVYIKQLTYPIVEMSFETFPQYPPVDGELVDRIVCKLKSQGIFDQFRKDCLADVDTKVCV